MKLGIEGRTAVVCGSSQGLGLACAQALAEEGVNVVLNGRDESKVAKAAERLREVARGSVTAVAADIATADGRDRLLATAPVCDILINNNGGPKPGYFADVDHDTWLQVLEANMIAPLMLTRSVLPSMKERRFGRIVNITSAMVKSPSPAMGLSTSARTGLTALCKAISREVVADNVTINNLLPERFDTDRQRFMAERMVREQGLSYEEARQRIVDTIAAGRLGQPREFGDACAFLCSAQAGYLSGQNLQLDGGSYRGVF